MPKITVIIPVLNTAKYIRECMDSVVNQTLKDIEIIPVDAGSTDGTAEILEEYAGNDERIHIIHSEKKSVGYQYNLGLTAAKGEYIGFVESDDYIVPDMYEILVRYAEKYKVDWVKSDYSYFMDYPGAGRRHMPVHDKKFCEINEVFVPRLCPEQYMQEIFMWRGIYRTDLIRVNGIRLNETPGAAFQDTGFILQAFMHAAKALYIDQPLYCYRRDNQNSSSHQAGTICYEIDEVEYITKIMKGIPVLYEAFGIVNYRRAVQRFFSSYAGLPVFSECPENVLHSVRRYRNYLLSEEAKKAGFYEACQVVENLKELIWLKEGLETFDARYREIESANEEQMREMVNRILECRKLIIFGCGDNGSGLLSLLLRHDKNEIVCLSDNDKKKWNQYHMGFPVVPPDKLSVDTETIVLVANQRFFCKIRAQLIALGISAGQIWPAPQVMRHHGTNLMRKDDVLPLR